MSDNVEVNLLRKLIENKVDIQLNKIPRNKWFPVIGRHGDFAFIKISEEATIKPINDIDFYKHKNLNLLIRISNLEKINVRGMHSSITLNAKDFNFINGEFYFSRKNFLEDKYDILSDEEQGKLEATLEARNTLIKEVKDSFDYYNNIIIESLAKHLEGANNASKLS